MSYRIGHRTTFRGQIWWKLAVAKFGGGLG